MLFEYDIYFLIAYLIILLVASVVIRFRNRDDKVKTFLLGTDTHMPIRNGIMIMFAEISFIMLFVLPGGIYSYGAGRAWSAVGVFIGMITAWVSLSYRFMRYTVQDDELYTLSDFFRKRFNTDSPVLIHITAAFTISASFLFVVIVIKKYAVLIEKVYGIPFVVVVFSTVFISLLYFIIAGNRGTIKIFGLCGVAVILLLVFMAISIYVKLKATGIVTNIMNSRFEGGASVFFNVLYSSGKTIGIYDIISQLSYGLVCFGIPHIIMGFFSFNNGREIGRARRSSSVYLFAGIIAAAVTGGFARAFLYPERLGNGENVILRTLLRMNKDGMIMKTIVVFGVCMILSALMIFTLRQLMVISTLLCGDYLRRGSFKRFYKKNEISFSRIILFLSACAICFFVYALPDRFTRYMDSVWIIIGSTFNAVMIFSLYWKRMNKNGAIAGVFFGFAVSLMWELNRKIEGSVLFDIIKKYIDINGILPAFVMSSLSIVLVSLVTKPCDKKTNEEFEAVEFRNV